MSQVVNPMASETREASNFEPPIFDGTKYALEIIRAIIYILG